MSQGFRWRRALRRMMNSFFQAELNGNFDL